MYVECYAKSWLFRFREGGCFSSTMPFSLYLSSHLTLDGPEVAIIIFIPILDLKKLKNLKAKN